MSTTEWAVCCPTASAISASGVDATVASIDYAYKVCGRLLSVSSENSSGTVLNEDYYQYDSNGNLDAEYEDAQRRDRPRESLGRPVRGLWLRPFGHGRGRPDGQHDRLPADDGPVSGRSRRRGTDAHLFLRDDPAAPTTRSISSIRSSTTRRATTLDSIGYLGDGTIVSENYVQPGVGYNLLGTTGGQPNLDEYGRVQDQVWTNASGMIDGYQYTYNPQGDVASKQNLALDAYKTANPSSTAPYLDEVYGYNGVDELTSLARGELNPAAVDQILAGTTDFTQNWTLDGNGNWSQFDESGTGVATVAQTRQTNSGNEITGYDDTSDWAVPNYDPAGNMIYTPHAGRRDRWPDLHV